MLPSIDLKPDNVLVSEDGRHVWLADFGLATDLPLSRDFGVGSPGYLSPGQCDISQCHRWILIVFVRVSQRQVLHQRGFLDVQT